MTLHLELRAGVLLAAALLVLLPTCTTGDGGMRATAALAAAQRAKTLGAILGSDVTLRGEGSFGLDRWSKLPDSTDQTPPRAFQVYFPKGSVSPAATRQHRAPKGGMQVYAPLVDGPLDAAYLRYWVRFPEGFAFVKGGKLPGFWGGDKVSGGAEPDGTNGFSTRLMWRAGGAGEVYLYAFGQSGVSLGRGAWTWPTGRWVCVEQQVSLNRADEGNGLVVLWLDGVPVYQISDVRYRSVDDLRIEGLFFSTFFGGDDLSWASPIDQHVDFAGFSVSRNRIGCQA